MVDSTICFLLLREPMRVDIGNSEYDFMLGLRKLSFDDIFLVKRLAHPVHDVEKENGSGPERRRRLCSNRPSRVTLWKWGCWAVFDFQKLAKRFPTIFNIEFEQLLRGDQLTDSLIVLFVASNRILFDVLVFRES